VPNIKGKAAALICWNLYADR